MHYHKEILLENSPARYTHLRAVADQGSPFIANSEAMKKAVEIAGRVARVNSSVLISGESGVGKELMAHFIHKRSLRASCPFVAVNCGALTETLLDSELFGHAKGAFTGARKDRVGLFEAANGGTLFLDEIGEISPAMQVKLLRALQENEVRRVGENRSRPVNVRVLAATNRNLEDEIALGNFRLDLYYRLRVIELPVPALRERPEDILPLAHFFLDRSNNMFRHALKGFTAEAADQLLYYNWPGNVRELQNAIEYAVAMCQGTHVDVNDLPGEIFGVSSATIITKNRIRPLDEVERDYILWVLKTVRGNKIQAAIKLNISVTTLYRRIKEYETSNAGGIPKTGIADITTGLGAGPDYFQYTAA